MYDYNVNILLLVFKINFSHLEQFFHEGNQ